MKPIEKPLFIVLKREYYTDFVERRKTVEYRPYGGRWNKESCRVGRRVTLSMGYGKHHRTHGVITGFSVEEFPEKLKGWRECYGPDKGAAACIEIKLESDDYDHEK